MTGTVDGGGALAPYRVVDLTTEEGWLCGKLLADLGADVIKVEPPGGDPGRRRGPFHGDVEHPERSLRWWAQNRGKRSVVLDLDDEAGGDDLRRLLRGADAVVESFPPGWLAARGLGPDRLLADQPSLVVTSITPFGQDGPHAAFAGPDLVLAATGGALWLTGDPDRPPVRSSVPLHHLHAGAEAAAHTVIALHHAGRGGEGQHVDVSAQLAAIRTLMNASCYPMVEGGPDLSRQGDSPGTGERRLPQIWPCKDGHVTLAVNRSVGGLFEWIAEEHPVPEEVAGYDWPSVNMVALAANPELVEAARATLGEFLLLHTKQELYDQSLARGFILAPIATTADVLVDDQLEARGYFRPVDHGAERGAPRLAGPWVRMGASPLVDTPAAPRTGQHTDEVLDEARRAPRVPATAARPAAGGTTAPPPDPFAGLKVWDMAWVGVGPLSSGYLADYGATVIRLDSSKRPDTLRMGRPLKDGVPGIDRSHFYANFNPSKLGIGLDVMHPRGREIAMRLVEWADVVTESFTPKTMAAWGMAYDDLRRVNPRLVMFSTCMQGQTGPRRDFRGFGMQMASLSGFYEVTGWPDRDPTPLYGAYTDFVCQRFGAAALAAAVDHQRRTGEGQHLDMAQYEAALQFLATELLDQEVNGRTATRHGNRDPFAAPHGVYPCRPGPRGERWIALAVRDDAEWAALVACMGAPAWATDARFATFAGRKAAEDELDERLAGWTAGHDADELFRALQPAVPAGPVHDQTALHADPQVRHRRYFAELHHTVMGPVPYDGLAATMSRTPGSHRKAAPCLGEDTATILRDVLGCSDDEIADLAAAGAIDLGPMAPAA